MYTECHHMTLHVKFHLYEYDNVWYILNCHITVKSTSVEV